MNKEIECWKWKNTIIDFNAISDEKVDCNSRYTKKDWIFQYLGCPDERMHEWYNGGFSCEYNTALKYALRRRTYATADFIMKHPELIDERVRNVMIRDLTQYFAEREVSEWKDDECDYQSWNRLYKWLLKEEE